MLSINFLLVSLPSIIKFLSVGEIITIGNWPICSEKRLYFLWLFFIDFLDCFIDSFLSDLVKLKQDLWHHWSLEVQDVKSLRIRQIYSFLWSKIEERYDKYVNSCEFAVLDCMNTLRLEPYLTNDHQRSIMKRMLDNNSLHANFNCPDGGTVK